MNFKTMLVAFTVILLIYASLNFYLFIRGWHSIPATTISRWVYAIVFGIFSLSFLVGMFGESVLPFKPTIVFQNIGFVWLGAILYLFLIVVAIDLVRLANYFFHFFPDWIMLNYPKAKLITFCSVLGVVAVVLLVGNIRFRNPVLTELKLKTSKEAFAEKPLRIVMFSDQHLGYVIRKKMLQKNIEWINSLKPDIVLCSGDLLDRTLKPVLEQNMGDDLRKINAPLGVYAVLGNHEYIGRDLQHALNFIEKKSGIVVLRDSVVNIADRFYLVGRDDRTNKKRKSIAQLIENIDTTKPTIMLDHQPYNLEETEKNHIDLQLSGHTHNGQLWPLNLVVNKIYEKGYGYLKKGNSHIYVSSGLGLWGSPFRIGTVSELVLITLE